MQRSFPQNLKETRPKIWKIIQSYLPKTPNQFKRIVSDYPNRQGQYLRPALLLFTNKILGGNGSQAQLTAASLQVSHEWLLIHDDVEDMAAMRRGKASLNKTYGTPLAVNTGDALHLIMWRMLMDNTNTLGPALGKKVSSLIQETLYRTTLGQFYELNWIQNKVFNISISDYLHMIDKKTGYYTITTPISLGAILCDRSDLIPITKRFSQPWGRVFQILNDIENIKKATGNKQNDIYEGKRTLLLIHILNKATAKERAEIKRIYVKSPEEKTPAEIQIILDLIKKYQAIHYAKLVSENLINKSRVEINKSGMNFLLEALEYTTSLELRANPPSKDTALSLTL